MFTGLVEGTGRITGRDGSRLTIRPEFPLTAERGDSIAVNGCCLTLERSAAGELGFFTLEETLSRTNLGSLAVGSAVNLERALAAGGRLDGHVVQGHVDAALKVLGLGRAENGDMELKVELPERFAALTVEKGSIAIDGVSLTVAETGEGYFKVCLIPETWARTALPQRRTGASVNVEFDILGKYVLRQLEWLRGEKSGGSLTWEKLSSAGFL